MAGVMYSTPMTLLGWPAAFVLAAVGVIDLHVAGDVGVQVAREHDEVLHARVAQGGVDLRALVGVAVPGIVVHRGEAADGRWSRRAIATAPAAGSPAAGPSPGFASGREAPRWPMPSTTRRCPRRCCTKAVRCVVSEHRARRIVLTDERRAVRSEVTRAEAARHAGDALALGVGRAVGALVGQEKLDQRAEAEIAVNLQPPENVVRRLAEVRRARRCTRTTPAGCRA